MEDLHRWIDLLRILVEYPDGTIGGLTHLEIKAHPEDRAALGLAFAHTQGLLKQALVDHQQQSGERHTRPYPRALWLQAMESSPEPNTAAVLPTAPLESPEPIAA